MPAPVDRSDVRRLVFTNPRARTSAALAASAGRAMRRRYPPNRALYPRGASRVDRALLELQQSEPHVAAAFDEATLRASAAKGGDACRWCMAVLIASVHRLPPPRLTLQSDKLLGPTCPRCPAVAETVWRRRNGLPPRLSDQEAGRLAWQQARAMIAAAIGRPARALATGRNPR